MRRIVLFVIVAALCRGTGAWALTIEAERAKVRTAGMGIRGGWNLFTNGQVGDAVRVAKAGKYRVVVRARGSPAKGVWPRMVLVVDGQRRGAATVASKEFAEHAFEIELAAGLHRVAVAFTNDLLAGREDRNLYLDRIVLEPPAGVSEPTLAAAEELTVEAQKHEDAAVQKATESIERHRKGKATVRVVDAAGKPVAGASVVAELARHDFLFGCNIYMFDRYKTAKENAAYKRAFRELFNAATTGFYWRGYEPVRGKPNYAYTDKVVSWCRRHGIRLKGHPLLWATQHGVPRWSKGQPSPEIQKQRVAEIIERYSGKIDFWEVVNEPSHLRALKIDEPYRWAREADPKAYLIVNDYYVMANGFPPFFKLLEAAKRSGVPFDGIGIQAHEPRTMRFPLESVQRILDRYATLGKELHITEFTPTSGGKPITGSHLQGKWDEAAQADYAAKFYTVCFGHPSVVAVTWWDLCDHGSWLPGGGMLRRDLSPKPVYARLKKLIHETWHTRAEGKTDAAGRFAFRGFFGQYAVSVQHDGATAAAKPHLAKATANEFSVTLSRP